VRTSLADCRYGEEVDRHRGLDVIVKQGPPGLGRWSPAEDRVFAGAGLAGVDAQLREFLTDPQRAQTWLLAARFSDRFPHVFSGPPSRLMSMTTAQESLPRWRMYTVTSVPLGLVEARR
jgi:hypothetical protein